MQKTPYQVIDIVQKLKDEQTSRQYRVRAVLKWFGAKRRGDAILSEILDTFARYELTTDPPFDKSGLMTKYVSQLPRVSAKRRRNRSDAD